MPKNTPITLPRKSPDSSPVTGGTFQKRKKLNSKNNTKKKRPFMTQNKTTQTKLKPIRNQFKSIMKSRVRKKKKS
jgi:hypothetical protein